MHVHRPPLTVANDHLGDSVVIQIGYFNRAYILWRANRPAWELPGNIVGVNKLPRLRYDKLLVVLTWERGELQVSSKAAGVRPLNGMRGRIDHLAVSRGDFDCRIVVHLTCDDVRAASACHLPQQLTRAVEDKKIIRGCHDQFSKAIAVQIGQA